MQTRRERHTRPSGVSWVGGLATGVCVAYLAYTGYILALYLLVIR